MFGGDFGLPPGMGVAPRVVRRPSPTYVTPSRLAARRAASLNSSSHKDREAIERRRASATDATKQALRRNGCSNSRQA